MPIMDGIQMLAVLKEKGLKHKTIILSGYSEFDYAQKAIKIGINEYLLKPVTACDLEQSLKNIEKELRMESMLNTNELKVINTAGAILQGIVLGGNSKNEERYQYLSDKYGISSESDFAVLTVYTGERTDSEKDRIKKLVGISIKEYSHAEFTMFELSLHKEIDILISNCNNFAAFERYFQNMSIKDLIREKIFGLAFGWIVFTNLDNLKSSLNTLRKELKWSAVLGEDVLISYPKIQQINTRIAQYPLDIENSAKAAACTLDIIKLKKTFEEFLSWWRKELYHPALITEAFIRFASSIINMVKEIDCDLFQKINQKEILQSIIDAVTWKELKEALYIIFERISSNISDDTRVLSLTIKRAVSMVNEFYKDGITLDQIAARLNITPEYLGTLFFKEMGIYFSTYIKEFRIKKAKELLISRELKTYEIAEQIGYSDPKYFSRVFKESTGLTPGEYQRAYK
jgi:two-component system response regulator YesN